MKTKLFNLCFTGIILITFILNFNSFLMGHPSKWFNIAISILYIIFWYIFILLSKRNKRRLIFSITWGFFTLVCAVITLIVNINDRIIDRIIVDFSIPFVMIFLTPLYGIEAFFGQARFLMASIVYIVVSIGWIITSSFFLKRTK